MNVKCCAANTLEKRYLQYTSELTDEPLSLSRSLEVHGDDDGLRP